MLLRIGAIPLENLPYVLTQLFAPIISIFIRGNKMRRWSRDVLVVLSIVAVALIAGCGGSSGTSNTGNSNLSKVTLSGTVAKGLPLPTGTTVTIKDKNGKTASTATLADGTYTFDDVSSMAAPFLLQVPNPTGGYMYSIATASGSGTANVHPFTDMIIRNWYKVQGSDVDTAFGTVGAMPTPPSSTDIATIEGVVSQIIATYMKGASVPAGFNLITTPFDANQTGFDLVLDNLTVTQPASGGDVTIGVTGGGTSSTILTIADSTALTTITPPPAPVSDTVNPTIPGAITATRTSTTQVVLNWGASTDTQLAGYKIYLNGTQVGITDQPYYIHVSAPATSACYTVSAFDAAGNSSAQNTLVCAPETAVAADATAPSQPSLTAVASSGNPSSQIDLSWTVSTDNVALAGYRVMVGGSAIATLSASTTTYSHTGLNASTQYNYTVVAIDTSGNVASSTVASATTVANGDTTPPTAPSGLVATAVSDTQINLTWTASTDAVGVTGYNVYVGTTVVGTSATASFSNVSLTASTQYCYTVKAHDAANNASAASAQACATTMAASVPTQSPIVGTWFLATENGLPSANGTTLTFNADGSYTGWNAGPNGDGTGGYGYEGGTYTWDSLTGATVVNDVINIILNQTGTLTVSGNTLIDGTLTWSRATPPTTIVGSWYDGDTNRELTFFANGDYMHSKSVTANVGATPGLEHGKYTWNASTGAIAGACPPDVDTNGVDGLSHPGGIACTGSSSTTGTAVVGGNTMSWTVNGNPTVTMTRVVNTTNPIVGSWAFEGDTSIVITFFANGDYMLSQSVTPPAEPWAMPGVEHGTYTWNPSNGAFATGGCPPIDTNGEAGLSHQVGGVCAANTGTIRVSGNKLVLDTLLLTRITEPVVPTPQTFTEYALPVGSFAFGIASGPDGNLWFTTDNTTNSIGKMIPGGNVTLYPIPSIGSNGQIGSGPQTIINGPDGNLWFVEGDGNKIAKITTAGVITEYVNTDGGWPQDLAVGPDGNIWFTDQGELGGGAPGFNANGAIGRVNVTTGVVTKYPLLTATTQANWITKGPDGAMWFTQSSGGSDSIARIDMAGVITVVANTGAAGIATGPDGNLWFTVPAPGAPYIAKMTTEGVITQYPVTTTATTPFFIKAAPDGNLWFGEPGGASWGSWTTAGYLGRVTTSGVVTEYTLPASSNSNIGLFTIGGLTVGSDGALWFAETQSGKIGRYHP